ncbi:MULTISPECIES: IS200/IS605 family transposase [unclassified Microcystis]|uniref:IS200/IS605 family transposase n=2 Tax=unclassified Microcystis TaxID=2643300 RepID=UPI00338E8F2F
MCYTMIIAIRRTKCQEKTNYRRKVFEKEHLEFLRIAFQNIADKWKVKVIEINGESDHIYILLTYPPHKLLSGLIANLKSTSCQLMWDNFSDHLKEISLFWDFRKSLTESRF